MDDTTGGNIRRQCNVQHQLPIDIPKKKTLKHTHHSASLLLWGTSSYYCDYYLPSLPTYHTLQKNTTIDLRVWNHTIRDCCSQRQPLSTLLPKYLLADRFGVCAVVRKRSVEKQCILQTDGEQSRAEYPVRSSYYVPVFLTGRTEEETPGRGKDSAVQVPSVPSRWRRERRTHRGPAAAAAARVHYWEVVIEEAKKKKEAENHRPSQTFVVAGHRVAGQNRKTTTIISTSSKP